MSSPNPWFEMWAHPRATIRSIIQAHPKYGFWTLACVYALASGFYTANFYSWGLAQPFFSIFLPWLILSPFIGWIWLSFESVVLRWTSRWFGGSAPYGHVRACVAWSKVPFFISLLMWVALMVSDSESAFIQYASGPSSLFISLITLTVNIWSIVLLIQSNSEVQSIGAGKSTCAVISSLLITWISALIIMYLSRFVYLQLI